MSDLEQELPDIWGRRLSTVFIGGGTPSLFSPESIDSIISGIRARIPSTPEMEITLEANPGSADARKFEELRLAGVTRLSIGVQSFNDGSLRRIGRIHDGQAARSAVTAAIDAGFDNFNLDLMYGLPGQSIEMAKDDVFQALSFDPPHLSCYQLTIEPHTSFSASPPALPDEDTIWDMQEQIEQRLENEGFTNYEVSAFARDGRSCRHNLNYWQFGDYIGIGAGAHGKLTREGRITRTWKLKHPAAYINSAGTPERKGGEKVLSAAEAGFEFMLNTLRLRQPFTVSMFQQRTGVPMGLFRSELEQAQAEGLLKIDGDRISATEPGRRFLNDLLQRFMPENDGLNSQQSTA
jgi:oxygen-independent coproporphyrinogen-3 oxidase